MRALWVAVLLAAAAWGAEEGYLAVEAPEGAAAVYAWYPFGRHVLLPVTGGWASDRFALPDWWEEAAIPVRVAAAGGDGGARTVWCVVPATGPRAALALDRAGSRVGIAVPREGTPLAVVAAVGEGGRMVRLDPAGRRWWVDVGNLGGRFTVVLRDRAGGRVAVRCRVEDGRLEVRLRAGRRRRPSARRPATVPDTLAATGRGLELLGGVLRLEAGGTVAAGRLEGAPRSLRLAAALVAPDAVLAATAAGDLIRFERPAGGGAVARVVASLGRPVVGLAPRAGGELLVGVLGRGVLALREGRLVPSGIRVGTRRVTALRAHRGVVFVGTDGRGLWRVVHGRVVRSRFPERLVTALGVEDGRLAVASLARRWQRRGCDRFELAGPAAPPAGPRGAPTAIALVGGEPLVGTASGRLVRPGGRPALLPEPDVGAIRGLATAGGAVWVGGEAGLVRLGPEGVRRVLEVPVHGLAPRAGGVVAATADGVWTVGADGEAIRWDVGGPPAGAAFVAAVAWRGGVAAAGTRGLWWWPAPGPAERLGPPLPGLLGEVTALLATGDGLLVGTAGRGVLRWDGRALRPVAELADLHVPPGAMAGIGEEAWIGTRDALVARLDADGTARRLAIPAGGVIGIAGTADGTVWLATEEGLATVAR